MPIRLISSDAQLPMEMTVDADKPTAISLMKYFFEISLFISYLYPTHSCDRLSVIASMVPQINCELNWHKKKRGRHRLLPKTGHNLLRARQK